MSFSENQAYTHMHFGGSAAITAKVSPNCENSSAINPISSADLSCAIAIAMAVTAAAHSHDVTQTTSGFIIRMPRDGDQS
jgi:hypothetical protein